MQTKQLISSLGGPTAVAKLLKIKPQAVIGWRNNNCVPLKRAIQIEQLTDGKYKAKEIRPDVFEAA